MRHSRRVCRYFCWAEQRPNTPDANTVPELTDTTIRNAKLGARPGKLSDGKAGRSVVVTAATTTRTRLLAPLLVEARTPAGAREMEAAV